MKSKTILGCFGLTLFVCSCNTGQQPVTTVANREVITVESSDFTVNESFTAKIEGRQVVDIFPQVSGRIQQVCITEGQELTKGQVMFVIDQVPYQAALRVADAGVLAAKAKADNAALELKGKKSLRKENVISDYDLSLAANADAIAKAQLEQAMAQQTNAQNNLSYTSIVCPVNGIAGTLPYREGMLVGPDMTSPLTTVSDDSLMYVYFALGESRLRSMLSTYGSRDSLLCNMPGLKLRLSDGSIYEYEGQLESISGVLNENTGTAQMRCVFPNPKRLLFCGAGGSVIIPFRYEKVITIPAESTFEVQGIHFVQKVVDGRASTRQVQIELAPDGRTCLVKGGLAEGDVIVASGAGLVNDGDSIM